jgi:hypothetical protein
MKLTKELINIIDENIGYLQKGLKSGFVEGDEVIYYETKELDYDRDESDGTYTTRQEIVEEVNSEIIKLETVENRYILLSEDSDYLLEDTETIELGYYRFDGTDMIPVLDSNGKTKFITVYEYLNN